MRADPHPPIHIVKSGKVGHVETQQADLDEMYTSVEWPRWIPSNKQHPNDGQGTTHVKRPHVKSTRFTPINLTAEVFGPAFWT